MKSNLALILAGGRGSRIRNELPKQFLLLKGKTILQYTIGAFENHPAIDHIFLATHGEFYEKTEQIVKRSGYRKVVKILEGGTERQDSSRIGVTAASVEDYENVLIHDAARPFVSNKIISDILEKLDTYSAVNVAIMSSDTIIEVDENLLIKSVPDRKYLRRVQTPQGFKLELIQRAHRLAREKGIVDATDDCSLVLKLKLADIYVVEGSPLNIKITYPSDLDIAEKILAMEEA
jgi:2-C-methyl-D-erythritol 4-phosphate cytidylyltransferase